MSKNVNIQEIQRKIQILTVIHKLVCAIIPCYAKTPHKHFDVKQMIQDNNSCILIYFMHHVLLPHITSLSRAREILLELSLLEIYSPNTTSSLSFRDAHATTKAATKNLVKNPTKQRAKRNGIEEKWEKLRRKKERKKKVAEMFIK